MAIESLIMMNLIMDGEFMNKFIARTNRSYKSHGTYEDVYMAYEGKLDDEDINELLYYCEENKLLGL